MPTSSTSLASLLLPAATFPMAGSLLVVSLLLLVVVLGAVREGRRVGGAAWGRAACHSLAHALLLLTVGVSAWSATAGRGLLASVLLAGLVALVVWARARRRRSTER